MQNFGLLFYVSWDIVVGEDLLFVNMVVKVLCKGLIWVGIEEYGFKVLKCLVLVGMVIIELYFMVVKLLLELGFVDFCDQYQLLLLIWLYDVVLFQSCFLILNYELYLFYQEVEVFGWLMVDGFVGFDMVCQYFIYILDYIDSKILIDLLLFDQYIV